MDHDFHAKLHEYKTISDNVMAAIETMVLVQGRIIIITTERKLIVIDKREHNETETMHMHV